MKKYNLLLLYADDTILDFSKAEEAAFQFACDAMGLTVTKEQFAVYAKLNRRLWLSFSRKEITQEALRVMRFSRFSDAIGVPLDAEQMADHFVEALSRQTQEIDGALEVVKEAAKRVSVVIVTNGIASVQRSRFALSPMGQFVAGMVISGEVGFAKPDPRMIERAVEISGVVDACPLMVGDEPTSDIAVAIAAGIDSCWFNPSGRANETPYRPTYEIKTLSEVMRWL
jgi:YjjG family noncanonical pyrimidine nucleotidase